MTLTTNRNINAPRFTVMFHPWPQAGGDLLSNLRKLLKAKERFLAGTRSWSGIGRTACRFQIVSA